MIRCFNLIIKMSEINCKNNNQVLNQKFIDGEQARQTWAKNITTENTMSISDFNKLCENNFTKKCCIELDDSDKRKTTLITTNFDKGIYSEKDEHIYAIVRNGVIMKIGGTRTGLKERWSSYLCGYCVAQRKKKTGVSFPGKMSVTNAYLYHTIEKDLLETNSNWEFWSWKLPKVIIPVMILGENTNVIAQTYHAFESICIKKFKDKTGHIPLLCDNSDPGY